MRGGGRSRSDGEGGSREGEEKGSMGSGGGGRGREAWGVMEGGGLMEGREWWCWAVVVICGQGVVVGCVCSPCVCGFSCLWAVVIHWWQVIIVQGWGIVICGLGIVHTVCWRWVVGGHLGVVCEQWGSSACAAHRSLWGADVHGWRLWFAGAEQCVWALGHCTWELGCRLWVPGCCLWVVCLVCMQYTSFVGGDRCSGAWVLSCCLWAHWCHCVSCRVLYGHR